MKAQAALLLTLTLLAAGCQTKPRLKITHERSWIGGEYAEAGRHALPRGDLHQVYVSQVYESTPAAQAGLRIGDRLQAINGRRILSARDFRRWLDSTAPGTPVKFEFLRDGDQLEGICTAGRETYQTWRTVSFGLHASTRLDLWPDPDWSVLGILEYSRSFERLELRSGQVRATRKRPISEPARSQGEAGSYSPEGWRLWLGIIGLGSHRRILSQEADSSAPIPR